MKLPARYQSLPGNLDSDEEGSQPKIQDTTEINGGMQGEKEKKERPVSPAASEEVVIPKRRRCAENVVLPPAVLTEQATTAAPSLAERDHSPEIPISRSNSGTRSTSNCPSVLPATICECLFFIRGLIDRSIDWLIDVFSLL